MSPCCHGNGDTDNYKNHHSNNCDDAPDGNVRGESDVARLTAHHSDVGDWAGMEEVVASVCGV